MFQVSHLAKCYGAHSVLEDVTFSLARGECVALVGPNGSGKSTLLRCITGQERPDAGSVTHEPGARVGFLPQELDPADGATVAGYAAGPVAALEPELAAAATALADASPASVARYDRAAAAFEAAGGYARLARVAEVLARLGLGTLDPAIRVTALSGGQKTRLMLARTLLDEPDVLLLDEPTNHLDLAALDWLAGFIRAFPGAVLVVSHDRAFIDDVAGAVLYLDPAAKAVKRYPGNYTSFAAARALEREHQAGQWKRQQEYIGRVSQDIARLKGEALAIEKSTTPRQPGLRVYARRKAAVAKAREKKLDRYLASDERVDKPKSAWGLKLDFAPGPDAGREAFRLRGVAFSYPGGPPVLRGVAFDILHGDRIAITGANGSGKTTLLRLLAGDLAPTAGEVWRSPNVRLAVITQEQENLDPAATALGLVRPLRAWEETDARNFLHFFLFAGDAVHRRVGDCSPGERARLQLALAVARGANLLLLDEPLNHLDIDGREHFEDALDAFPGTVVAVSHDRRFVQSFARRTIALGGGHATITA
jgi:ATPase subunit of ABC transporter with duplicated ATPase domains